MQNTILCQYLVPSNLLNIYRCWGDEELDGISAHGSKIASQQSKFAILFGDFDYLASDNSTLAINYEEDMPSAFHFDSRESAIAAWEQFKARNNFQRYQELIDVAIA